MTAPPLRTPPRWQDSMSKPRKITVQDMVDYYDAILANGDGLCARTRKYISELRQGNAELVALPQEGNER